ncbi:hypothetical protein JCM8115_004888 [Rhodotorula mucilaginosa]|uniref:Enoyl reductase (ER) domain-containing protein n=1 Tax=Rhodotorula mucilaginosa TaxID=5537 RepID=A0A9P6W4D3_RHOMI|nr:hypothetical protein C6P46_003448 [Rhodotorula mucilaginosa]TKA57204.1 hypothetical protein B0A53_01160 [Rhodotorula sp. CCFEE 5036]
MSSSIPAQYTGYAALDEEHGKKFDLQPWSYSPMQFREDFIDIKIECCGICGSDAHTVTNGWPAPTQYPAIVGHEIIGTVVRAGANTTHRIGDRVGVGAQAFCCDKCDFCKRGLESQCAQGMIGTYQGPVLQENGQTAISQGGYADYTRVQGKLAVKLPDHLDSATAAPLLCAGVTVYAPLRRFGCGPGKKVGIIGIGGLGHLALQIASAMGAEVYALSHSDSKLQDAQKLGVKPENFIITKDVKEVAKKYNKHFDILLNTSSGSSMPLETLYFPLLNNLGALVLCGLPEDKLPPFYVHQLVGKSLTLAGSLIGGTTEIHELFELAAKHDIKAWVTTRPMKEASAAIRDMEEGKARYRFVLQN